MLSRAVDIYIFIFIRHSHAQFEDNTLGNIQPVKVMVEDVTKTVPHRRCRVVQSLFSNESGGFDADDWPLAHKASLLTQQTGLEKHLTQQRWTRV